MTNGSSPSNDSRRLSQLQDANTGLCHYQGLSPAIPNLRSLHKWQFNPDATWCHGNELLSCVVDSHNTKPLVAHSLWTTTHKTPFAASLHAWQRVGYRHFQKHLPPGAGIFLHSMLMPPCKSHQASPSSPTSPTRSRWVCHTARPTLCSQSCL